MTVEAHISKHCKKDLPPLHANLARQVREWLKDIKPGKKLFPLLDKRKTWLMIKHDLKAAGIPYRTVEGVADFHAAGRHTYITELLRNGVSLPEARELARHSDINMTMRCTHIGLEDQSRGIQALPALQMRCISSDFRGLSEALIEGETGIRHIRTDLRNFQTLHDYPMYLAGHNLAPVTEEHILGTMITCLTHIYEIEASKKKIVLDKLELDVEGTLTTRLGNTEKSPTYSDIRYSVQIASPESLETIQELQRAVEATCPIYTC